MGVWVDSRDRVFVVHLTDSFNAAHRERVGARIRRPASAARRRRTFSSTTLPVRSWATSVVRARDMTGPSSNQRHRRSTDKGNVWIGGSGGTDTRILKFSRDGKFIAQFGKAAAPIVGCRASRGTGHGIRRRIAAAAAVAVAAVGRGRGGRGERRASAEQREHGHVRRRAELLVRREDRTKRSSPTATRNHRVAVLRHRTPARSSGMWGAYGNKPDDAQLQRYNPAGPAGQAVRAIPCTCAKLSNDGLVYVCDTQEQPHPGVQEGQIVREGESHRSRTTRGTGSVWDVAFSSDPKTKTINRRRRRT